MIPESARWGDYRGTLYTRNGHWLTEKARLRDSYFPARSGVALNQFRADGLYPAVTAPAFNRHGGRVTPGFQLVISAPAGTIRYTLDGSDSRLPGKFRGTGCRLASAIAARLALGDKRDQAIETARSWLREELVAESRR